MWQVKLVSSDGEIFIHKKALVSKYSGMLRNILEGVLRFFPPGRAAKRGRGFRFIGCDLSLLEAMHCTHGVVFGQIYRKLRKFQFKM